MRERTLLCPDPLPVERILFDSPLVRIGSFRCPTSDPLFVDSGPIVNPIFVFPRTGVWIEHEGREPFVVDPLVWSDRCQRARRVEHAESRESVARAPAHLGDETTGDR